MKQAIKYVSLLLLLVVSVFGCQKKNKQEVHNQHSGQIYTCPMHPQITETKPGSCPICGMDLVPVSQIQSEKGIMLSASQVKLANIQTQVATKGNIGNYTLLTATTAANKNTTAQVSSRVAGRIEKLYIKQTGQRIQKGDPLYSLYSESLLTLQEEYLLALAQEKTLGNTDHVYKRILQGAREKLLLYGMSGNQVQELESTGKAKPAVTFFSHEAGVVETIAVSEGQYVAEGNPIITITDLSTLWVEAQLYPTEQPMVSIGDTLDVRLNGYGNKIVQGKVVFLTPELSANSKIILMRVQIENPAMKYIPGMQASVTLVSNAKKSLMLPVNAVLREEQGSYVWQQIGKGTFSPVMVQLGTENATSVEILSGIAEGDTVVVSGAYLLHSEYILKKGGNPMAGHDHSQMNM